MQKLLSQIVVFSTALLLAIPATSQTATHAPDGRSFERIQSITILPKPGAPFSATVVTEWTRLLEDGTTTTIRNHRTIARDGNGRIFEERRFFTPTGDKQETMLTSLEYSDPARREFYSCKPTTHICMVYPFNAPATAPPTPTTPVQFPNGAGGITHEDLGRKSISDLDVIGSREITTINPGTNTGYARPEPTIKEFWYSPRLEINLIVKRFEPRGGAQSFTVQNINLTPPDPKLFEPPTGYRIIRTDIQ
ncbi:hypothetical protein [Granulicella sibirica]|uniref:Uncharacterized protein n=1 Tax=Granulicella sibirica TaxID=2479048 RepID=A0A4Q0SYH1_9BACT|nr:hypothetical protein [Granulicella sibirica]RXH55927.1 hypothetical protein GRAN_2784 [Granulicella sibirica]